MIRTPLQCRDKWENHFRSFRKVRDWEKGIPSGLSSFWDMNGQEHESHGLPRSFDHSMFGILEVRFGNDVLVDPGDILVDSSERIFNECNASHGGNGNASRDGGVYDDGGQNDDVSATDQNSTGKKRRGKESRTADFKREFQDISKNLMETMERSSTARSQEQGKHVHDLLAIQERHAKAAEQQANAINSSLAQITSLLGAYLVEDNRVCFYAPSHRHIFLWSFPFVMLYFQVD